MCCSVSWWLTASVDASISPGLSANTLMRAWRPVGHSHNADAAGWKKVVEVPSKDRRSRLESQGVVSEKGEKSGLGMAATICQATSQKREKGADDGGSWRLLEAVVSTGSPSASGCEDICISAKRGFQRNENAHEPSPKASSLRSSQGLTPCGRRNARRSWWTGGESERGEEMSTTRVLIWGTPTKYHQ